MGDFAWFWFILRKVLKFVDFGMCECCECEGIGLKNLRVETKNCIRNIFWV